ncbi:MAG: hypothetical protein HY852_03485 [Bradyrhizobium sp.]|uniref:hypothetical protein n=1 Tax=Bradyrhizobium sp. TaxID=376 RepID=UPI0025BA321F|nr:hypothetical protein [Bradyrhizobium sp.]MBI5260865.1 hypothetical protein [Bradyrhizobium sp.]
MLSSKDDDRTDNFSVVTPSTVLSQDYIQSHGFSVSEALDRFCDWTQELGPSERLRPDGAPFSRGQTCRPVSAVWSELCGRLEAEQVLWFGRKNDPTVDWSRIPGSAAIEFSIADIVQSRFSGPHEIKLYDVKFLQAGAGALPAVAAPTTDRPSLKRGPKGIPPNELNAVMQSLVLRLIRERKGLPKGAADLCTEFAVEAESLKKRGKTTKAREFIMQEWCWLYDACAEERSTK